MIHPLKKRWITAMVAAGVFLVGMVFMAWKYYHQKRELESVKARLLEVQPAMGEKELHLVTLRFKENLFRRRDPLFSHILDVVVEKSDKYGFDPSLIMALITVESGFKPRAHSANGAYGLMQVHYAVWKDRLDIDFKRIYEVEYNVELGMKILKHYMEMSGGNLAKALSLYNSGYKGAGIGFGRRVVVLAKSFSALKRPLPLLSMAKTGTMVPNEGTFSGFQRRLGDSQREWALP